MKRTQKFYSRNEKEVMKILGLTPTIASGSTWLEKEDGYNENILCQLKSTDAESIKINLFDIETLEHNAYISDKLPIFVIQFLQNRNELDMGTYILIRPSELTQILKYLEQPDTPIVNNIPFQLQPNKASRMNDETIVSSAKAKKNWWKEQKKKWGNK